MIERFGFEITNFSISSELQELVLDRDEHLLIINKENIDELISSLPSQASILDNYSLIELQNAELMPLFSDYGFISSNNRTYLFKEAILAFSITSGDTIEIEMALLQFEEYLIAKVLQNNESVYFVDKNYKDLIIKVASAYDINVHIFDLDK